MTTYGYGRVSSLEQKLDIQESQLKAAGCQIIVLEKASGADNTRPELAALIERTQSGDVIIVCKLDRLARSTQHLLHVVEQLDRKGVAFKALNAPMIDTTIPAGKLMLVILAAIAEFERGILRERQRDGIEAAKAAGKYKGSPDTARRQSGRVMQLLAAGGKPADVATALGMGVASVYRIRRAAIAVPAALEQTVRQTGMWLDGELPLGGTPCTQA